MTTFISARLSSLSVCGRTTDRVGLGLNHNQEFLISLTMEKETVYSESNNVLKKIKKKMGISAKDGNREKKVEGKNKEEEEEEEEESIEEKVEEESALGHVTSLLLPREVTLRHLLLVVIFLLLAGGFALQVRLSLVKYGRTAMTVSDLEVKDGLELPRLAVCPGFRPGAFDGKATRRSKENYPKGKGMDSYFDAKGVGEFEGKSRFLTNTRPDFVLAMSSSSQINNVGVFSQSMVSPLPSGYVRLA